MKYLSKMHTVHKNLLKKFQVEDIAEMRKMAKGIPIKIIAKHFHCHPTTVMWHVGDIVGHYPESVEIE